MSVINILNEHSPNLDQTAVFMGCNCGWGTENDWYDGHLAEVLEQYVAEQREEAKAEALATAKNQSSE